MFFKVFLFKKGFFLLLRKIYVRVFTRKCVRVFTQNIRTPCSIRSVGCCVLKFRIPFWWKLLLLRGSLARCAVKLENVRISESGQKRQKGHNFIALFYTTIAVSKNTKYCSTISLWQYTTMASITVYKSKSCSSSCCCCDALQNVAKLKEVQ